MKRPIITPGRLLATIVVGLGLYAAYVRIVHGLGAATNLSDAFPWGIWVGFDVLVGVGLAAGGFTITATVHLFNLRRFEAIIRPTILTAFLGYLLVIAGLLFDLGRPFRIWHPILMWNPSSVMFEVAWCVTLYTTVLALEFSPIVFEKLGLEKPRRWVHAATIPLVIAGVILSTLHQSSLGTLYVILPDKLHALWYSPLLPVHFFLSAIAAGLGMVILESFASARAFGRRLEFHILIDLARAMLVVLGIHVLVRAQDLLARSALGSLDPTTPEGFLFLTEVGFGALLPLAMLASPRVRASSQGLRTTALLVVLGFILNRLNVTTTGVQRALGEAYFPSLLEIAVTGSLVVIGITGFRLAARHLNIFPPESEEDEQDIPSPVWVNRLTSGALLSLALVLAAGLAALDLDGVSATQQPAKPEQAHRADHRPAWTPPEDIVLGRGEDSPGPVVFSHETHVEEPACRVCHESAFPIVPDPSPRSGPVARQPVDPHGSAACGTCHNGTDAFAVEDACETCHDVD